MTLRERQSLFVRLVGLLIEFAYQGGYELTFGEAFRTPEQAKLNAEKGIGIGNSLHTQRLAIDLNLFKDGQFLTDSAAYKPLGDFWKALHPDCCFGGDFKPRADGNHFSLSWNGIK